MEEFKLTYGFVMQVLVLIATGGAVYGAIRADLKNMHAAIASATATAVRAHDRIDRHLDVGRHEP